MKRWIAQAAVIVVAGCAAAPTHESLDYVTRSKTGEGPTTEELVNDHRSPDDVLTYGMGYSQQRYSPLAQINKSNVKRLAPVWSLALKTSSASRRSR